MGIRGILLDFGETLSPQSMSQVLRRPSTFLRLGRLIAAGPWPLSPLTGLLRLYREYGRAQAEARSTGRDVPLPDLVARVLCPLPHSAPSSPASPARLPAAEPSGPGEDGPVPVDEPAARRLTRGLDAETEPFQRLAGGLEAELGKDVHLYPAAVEAVQVLQAAGYRLGILSNGIYSSRFVREVLDRHGIGGLFPLVIISCEAGRRKPDRDLFLAACAGLGLPPAEVVYVGDDWEKDVVGAREAGLQAVWFQNGRRPWNSRASAVPTFSDWRELPVLLDRLGGAGRPGAPGDGTPPQTDGDTLP